jgi:hypothetical protein
VILGVHMSLFMGPTFAVPAPLPITEALAAVEITQTDTGRSGFRLTFHVGRSGPWDLPDYRLLLNPLLRPWNRVILMVRFNLLPTVLIDGFITQFDLVPSEDPGGSTLVVTGEDVSVMMTLEQTVFQYPGLTEQAQVVAILAKYAVLGWTGGIIDVPTVPDPPGVTHEWPTQNASDYDYLQHLASSHGFAFYVRPGPLPNTNIPYWGPAVPKDAFAQVAELPALTVNTGPATNVNSVSFNYDALAPEMVLGDAVEPTTNVPVPVVMPPISTDLPLEAIPAAVNQGLKTRVSRPGPRTESERKPPWEDAREAARTALGLSLPQAFERARARVNDSSQNAVTATGELDALRYGAPLMARSVVDLRGAGYTNDGYYFVQGVTHSISTGRYTQQFSLRRAGVGTVVPLVVHP